MRILVLGATGVAGRSTVPRLLGAGHHVRVHVRNPLKAQALRRAGVEVVWGDTGHLPDLSGWMRGCDAVFDFRISVPSAARSVLPGAWRQYAYLRDVMVSVLVDAALEAGVGRVVHDTAAMVYVGEPEAWLTEDAPVHATGVLKANLAAEQHLGRFTAAGGIGVALRLGPLYGPDDVFSREVIAAARRGWSYAIGPAEGWTSALHTDDIGPAALAALRLPAGIYNVVDDEPLWRRELVALLARAVDRERLHRFPEWTVPPDECTGQITGPIPPHHGGQASGPVRVAAHSAQPPRRLASRSRRDGDVATGFACILRRAASSVPTATPTFE